MKKVSLASLFSADAPFVRWADHSRPMQSAMLGEQFRSTKDLIRFSECAPIIHELAMELRYAHGIKKGDIWAIKGFDPVMSFFLIVSARLNGACIVPFNPLYPDEYDHLYLNQAPIGRILRASSWRINRQPVVRTELPDDDILERWRAPIDGSNADDTPFLGIFTSGSSGSPKAVMHSLGGLIASAKSSIEFYQFSAKDTFLLSLGIHHIGGLMILLRGLCVGASVRLCDDLFSDIWLHQPNVISMVPTQLNDALQRPRVVDALSGAKVVIIGGAALRQELRDRAIEQGIPLSVSYGSTETGAQIAASRPGQASVEGQAGFILPNRQVRLSQKGKIEYRGAGIMLGYYQAKNFHPLGLDQWFESQDLGCWRGDELFVFGRADDTHMIGGEAVSRIEIQSVIDGRQEQLKEEGQRLTVLMLPDDRLGKVPVLVWESLKRPEVVNLLQFMERYLPSFKRPRSIYWLTRKPDHGKANIQFLLSELTSPKMKATLIWSRPKK